MSDPLADLFYTYGNTLTKHDSASKYVGMSRFIAFFGVSPSICAKAWHHLKDVLPPDYKENHLLWALLFLKCYNTEHVNRSIPGCDEKTFRKRVWVVVEKLAFMKVVRFSLIVFLFYCEMYHNQLYRSNGKTGSATMQQAKQRSFLLMRQTVK